MDKRTLRSKKGRPRNARQYDRPNQGIFGKVYSTMKGILQPTSWIINSVSNWIGNSTEEKPTDCADIEEDTVREDNDIVSQSVSHGNKRLRLRFDDNISSIRSSGTQTWPDQPSQNLYDSVSHVQSSTTQTSLLENKESITVLNGDDHSENSEGSASTSGCSSLVSSHKDSNKLVESPFHSLRSGLKNNRKRKEPCKSELDDLNNSRTLWSSRFGASSKCQRRFPTISHTNQPSFNLSTFVGPSKLNESVDKKITSPFYEGRTSFGGASASRRMPPSVAPYQVDKSLRNQIKVREHNSEDNLEGMSSAAKRILLTLEKMSTPVADAKKIPNTKTSPVDLSVYLTPPKSRRNSQFTPTISSKGPPIANINTIAKLTTLKNYGVSRLRNTLPSNSLGSVGQESYNFDNLQPNSSDSLVQSSGGGKMKNKLNQHHQSSKNINGENRVLETPDLPNIPLTISKLPTINFGAKVEKPIESNHSAKGFTFSNPIEHDLAINNAVSTSSFALLSSFQSKTEKNSDLQPKPFVFSSPIEHELPSVNVLPKENASLPVISISGAPTQSTWECSECWVRNSSSRNSCIACETSRAPKENISASVKVSAGNPGLPNFTSVPSTSAFTFSQPSSLPGFTFGKSTASETVTPSTFSFGSDSKTTMWECSACWVKNVEKDSKCIACETVRVKKDNINTKTVDSGSASNTATWECSECWVKNSAKESKCVACESPRSPKENNQGSTSVVNTSDKWECDSCWVKNPSNESKCIACESTRSSKVIAEVKISSSDVFSTWECTSCWVRNPMTEKKCKACETLHPSADKSSGFKDTNGFKFSSPIQNSPITFKFGNYVCTAPSTVTTSTFKFGIATSEPQTTTSTTGFNCGASSKTSTSSFFSTSAVTESTQNSKGITNENSSTKTGTDKVNEDSPKLDTVNENNTEINTVVEKGGFTVKTSVPTETSVQSGGFEVTNPLLASKTTENKVSDSVITSTSSETLVSKAKEVVTPSVTACFSFTTQPLLDSKKSETFPFGDQRKKKVSSQPASSPFAVFPTPSKDKLAEDEKSSQPEINSTDTTSENKLSSVFQPVSQSQQVSSAFTALTNAPVFKFGEKTDSSKNNLSTTSVTPTTSSFSFSNSLSNYTTVTDSKASEVGSAVSETVPPASTVKTDDKVSSAVTVSSAPSTTSSFVFGNTGTSSTPSAFSFFAPSSTSTAASSVFTFGASSNTAQTSKSGGFTFKGLEKPPSVTSIASATFVSPTQTTTSVLNVGTSAPVPSGGFVFGTPKTEAQSTAATPFAFGSGTASAPSMSAFSAFQPSQSASTAFQFGSQPSGSTSSTIGTSSNFAFAKSEMSNQVPSSASQNPVSAFGSPASNFVFAAKSETANQIPSSTGSQAPALAFGGSATSSFSFSNKTENTSTVSQNPNPTFGSSMPSVFGSTPVVTPFGSTDKPASTGFNFGGASTTSGVFQFGATNNTTERKRPAGASGFSFGTPTASDPSGSFQANFNMNTPPSFNFGATSTPAGPFQFAASSAPKSSTAQSAPRKYRKALRRVRKD